MGKTKKMVLGTTGNEKTIATTADAVVLCVCAVRRLQSGFKPAGKRFPIYYEQTMPVENKCEEIAAFPCSRGVWV